MTLQVARSLGLFLSLESVLFFAMPTEPLRDATSTAIHPVTESPIYSEEGVQVQMTVAQQLFVVFFAIIWGTSSNAWPRWKPFHWTFREDARVWNRIVLSLRWLNCYPVIYFASVLAFLSLGPDPTIPTVSPPVLWRALSLFWWVFQAGTGICPAFAFFGMYRIWMGRIESDPERYYYTREQLNAHPNGALRVCDPARDEPVERPLFLPHGHSNLAPGWSYICAALVGMLLFWGLSWLTKLAMTATAPTTVTPTTVATPLVQLIEFEDANEQELWINAAHVMSIKRSGNAAFTDLHYGIAAAATVKGTLDEVVKKLNKGTSPPVVSDFSLSLGDKLELGSLAQWAAAALSFVTLGWTVWLVFYRDRFKRPSLTIKSIPDVQQQDPPLNNPSARWVRFRVANGPKRQTAKNCRAYLIGLYMEQSANTFGPMSPQPYNDVRQLTWTHGPRHEATGRDILPGATQRFDLLATTRQAEGDFLQLQTIPMLPDMTIVAPGSYLAEVQVTADETAPQTMKFLIRWSGRWQDATAEEFKAHYRIVTG